MSSIRLLVALAFLAVVAYAGHVGHDIEHHHHKHGWGWPKYQGWAQVSHWQSPQSYQYGLKESGKGWAKQIWVGQEFKGWHHG